MDAELYNHEGRGKGLLAMASFWAGLVITAAGGYLWATNGPEFPIVASTVTASLVVVVSLLRARQPSIWRLRITERELTLSRPGKPEADKTITCAQITRLFVKARKRLIVLWATDRAIVRIPPEVISDTRDIVDAIRKANPGIEVREL